MIRAGVKKTSTFFYENLQVNKKSLYFMWRGGEVTAPVK